MELYSFLRAFADSWMLALMALFFLGTIIWAFRPGSRKVQDEVANSIFRNDTRPARGGAEASKGPQQTEARQ